MLVAETHAHMHKHMCIPPTRAHKYTLVRAIPLYIYYMFLSPRSISQWVLLLLFIYLVAFVQVNCRMLDENLEVSESASSFFKT